MRNKNRAIVAVSTILTITALAVGVAAPARAQPPNACTLQGTWIGAGGSFLSSYHGQTPDSGTIDLEYFNALAAVQSVFPAAAAISQAKGVWQRIGPRTFAYTILAHAVNDMGEIVVSALTSGTKQLPENCNSSAVQGCIRYLDTEGNQLLEFCPPPTAETRLQLALEDIELGNQPPVAVAEPDGLRTAVRQLRFDGSKSADPEGQPLTFSWKVTGGSAALMHGNTATPTVQLAGGAGEFTFELTVTDPEGASDTTTVGVTYVGR